MPQKIKLEKFVKGPIPVQVNWLVKKKQKKCFNQDNLC